MFDGLIYYLQNSPVLVFFLTLSFGYLIGNIRLMGISLGPVGGVLIAGLFFGHLGFSMFEAAQTFGFVLFIFCVGYQAGPQFIDVLLSDGLKYLSLAIVVALTGFIIAVISANLLGLAPGFSAGILGGAMTMTPTLAAAQEAVNSGLANIPDKYSMDEVLTNIGAGYALTYLFGLVGLTLIIRLLPRVLNIDLPAEAAKLVGNDQSVEQIDLSTVSRRVYRVTKQTHVGESVWDLQFRAPGKISVSAIRRNGERIILDRETKFEMGDEVLVIGKTEYILNYTPDFGEEVTYKSGLDDPLCTAQIVIQNAAIIGKTPEEIRLDNYIGILPLGLRRHRRQLTIGKEYVFTRGDVLTVYGPESSMEHIAEIIGHVERDVAETDLFTFALGIAIGISIGTLSITLWGVTIKLGMAGGLLISGVAVGFLRSIWPIFGRVPSASRWVLMELGLLMFMAGVGINSGGGIVEVILSSGIQLISVGILVTSIPVFIGYFFGRKVLKLNPVSVLGGIAGSMTSGAALSVVASAAKNDAPSLGYASAYAFASVILTLAGTLIMLT